MADYTDIKPTGQNTQANLWRRLTDLLVGNYSVEVLPDGDSIIYRVWFDEHCDISKHQNI